MVNEDNTSSIGKISVLNSVVKNSVQSRYNKNNISGEKYNFSHNYNNNSLSVVKNIIPNSDANSSLSFQLDLN
jgi:hypothetical protein